MSIFLYVVRHGEAEPVLINDKERELTENGRLEAQRTGKWLQSQLPQFDLVMSSPYIRAQQTKNIILESNAANAEIVTEQLIPSGIPQTAIDEIFARIQLIAKPDQHILCVSHMPLVSYMIGELSGYTPVMATAAVAKLKLDVDKWSGQLDTLIAPEQMQ